MTRYLLDANHLSFAIRRPAALRERIANRHWKGDKIGTCVPVLCEVEAGLRQLTRGNENRKRLVNLRRYVRTWPIDEPLIDGYGEFYSLARQRGRVLSFVDLLLAAMAKELNAVVLTTDRDFEAFPEIHTSNWLNP